ncbi:SprT-like domain-containing protein [Micromonospora aurantiaca]|uniref:SprT-like domain-containing protein n=1 Tax=Micromonospora aurantiaca (nom. illeg.) TaxID=47850 RepID=UPI0033C8407A
MTGDQVHLAALLNHGHWRLNAACFGGRLALPNWHLADELVAETGAQCDGGWWPDDREIRLRKDLLADLSALAGVMLHEMVHQYVWEVARRPEDGHGLLFTTVATVAGRPVGIAPPLPRHVEVWPAVTRHQEV